MIPSAQIAINLLDQLRESDRKLTEALLEIVRPAKLDGWPNPYDCEQEAEEKDEQL